MLRAGGRRCWLGGNLGGSLLDNVDDMSATDWVVVELSSFQLARLPDGCPAPSISVVTNCTPNHLDWHSDWASYVAAKQRLLNLQQSDGIAIVGVTPNVIEDWRRSARGAFFVAEDHLSGPVPSEWPPHLRTNARLAAAAARTAGASDTAIAQGFSKFRPLEHRQQMIGQIAGRTFIDDSKATTPEATIAALGAQSGPVWLLLGGSDKQCDFAPLFSVASDLARGVACFGAVGPRLAQQFCIYLDTKDASLPVAAHPRLDEALAWCWSQSVPGDTILLSPGCASHDQYADYIARAEHFRRLVNDLRAEDSNARRKSLAPRREGAK
jgi:UDP-N-acetylmuramoylalanine--D-glutamate ligase